VAWRGEVEHFNARKALTIFAPRETGRTMARLCRLVLGLALLVVAHSAAQAETLSWATRPNVSILSPAAPDVVTPSIVTITSSATGSGSVTAGSRVVEILPGGTLNGHTGIVQSEMDATTDDSTAINTTTFAFSRSVYNLCFTIVDIDGSSTTASGGSNFNDIVQLSPVPSSAPTIGSNVTYNAVTGRATSNGAYVTNANGDLRVCYAGPISSVSVQHIAGPINGTNPTTQFTAEDDLTYDLPPRLAVQKSYTGAAGAFTFNFDISNSGTGTTATTVTTSGAAVNGTMIILNAISTATTITETGPTGWIITNATITCTDANSATSGNPASFTAARSNYVITVAATNIRPNALITCAIANGKRPTLQARKISQGATATFDFTGSNGYAGDSITTTAVNTAAAGTVLTLTAAATATTLTETALTGWEVNGTPSCTGMGAGAASYNAALRELSLNVAATAASNNIVCTFTNRRLPRVSVSKTTTGGFGGPFAFADTGLTGSFANVSTPAAATPTASGSNPLYATAVGQAVVLTEAVATGFITSGVSCSDANATITGNAGAITSANNVVTIPVGNMVAGADYLCTFTNALVNPQLSIVKTASTAGPVNAGDVVTYTYTVTNSGNVAVSAISVSDSHNGYGSVPVPGSEALVTDNAPLLDSTDSSPAGIWTTLGQGDVVRFTASYTVVQDDIDFLQ
jgi:hypothetical protein